MLSSLGTALFLSADEVHAQGAVWVVDDDPGPGVDFTSLNNASLSAQSGDVLLVKDGLYGGLSIQGKSLTVVAESGETPEISLGTTIGGLQPDQVVVLSGLALVAPNGPDRGLLLEGNEGRVILRDCTVVRSNTVGLLCPEIAMVRNSDAAVFLGCELQAYPEVLGVAFPCDVLDSIALCAENSSVFTYDCTITGGGGLGVLDGSPGVNLQGGLFFASNTVMVGADGKDGVRVSDTDCVDPGDGGDAIRANGAEVFLHSSVLSGGLGGRSADAGCGGPGSDGQDVNSSAGTVTSLSGGARGYQSSALLRSGEAGELTFQGNAGEAGLWLASLSTDPILSTGLSGLIVPALPFDVVFLLPSLPGSGTQTLPIQISLPLGVDSLLIYSQALFRDSINQARVLSSPSVLVVTS